MPPPRAAEVWRRSRSRGGKNARLVSIFGGFKSGFLTSRTIYVFIYRNKKLDNSG